MKRTQGGVTLIEVLISLLVLGIGLLGAAAMQLNALKFTDSSTLQSQASFIAYDMLDRIRANPDASYKLDNLAAAPTANLTDVRAQDLADFAANVTAMGGATAKGSIAINGRLVTISITWDDSRAANAANSNNASDTANAAQTYTLVSRVAINTGIP
ncbi:type IV pilus modification protein PilV [Pseudomonas sp. nanlin1]|uniref:type IV pilus modification protein PilV n=1 Tax=Pseudomonas sp. nanlin1 TaxID=3040605 RepID=UPI00388CFA43